ncbi:MAG: succinate dehydrogenase assembly factor 2 [Woeseiaceae bacterium]|nr:succinate dehydrogenase assembly factor 2 [Woeseiaceae bacterium]
MTDPEFSRLRWQCRRGMRELDALLVGWLEDRYPTASDSEKSAFQELLTVSDPELVGYLLKKEAPRSEPIAAVVRQILERDHS